MNRAPCYVPHHRPMTALCPRPHQDHPPYDDAASILPRGHRRGIAVECRPSPYRHGHRDAAAAFHSSRLSRDTRNTAPAADYVGVAAVGAVEVASA